MENVFSIQAGKTANTTKPGNESGSIIQKNKGILEKNLGKDAFLKLLVTELQHQDPTSPMKDREFISQMAQFSSLEQMSNMNNAIQRLNRSSRSGEAYSLLGKRIEAFDPVTKKKVEGVVTSLFYKNNQIRLSVNGRSVGLSDIHAVYPAEKQELQNVVKGEGVKQLNQGMKNSGINN